MNNDTAIISCFFNFKDFHTPKRNFSRWKRQIDSLNIPNFGIELNLNNYNFISDDINWEKIVCQSDDIIMFQKEALWNKIEKNIPEQYTKIILCDCDIWFDSLDWFEKTSKKLDDFKVCSPCETFFWTDNNGKPFQKCKSFGSDFRRPENGIYGHSGFSIAIRRSFWKEVGEIYPYCISGDGSTALGAGLAGWNINSFYKFYNDPKYIDWYDRANSWCNKKISFIEGVCYHEYHGEWNDRQYTSRHQNNHLLDVSRDIKINQKGYLEWTDQAPLELKEHLKSYFFNRKEDLYS